MSQGHWSLVISHGYPFWAPLSSAGRMDGESGAEIRMFAPILRPSLSHLIRAAPSSRVPYHGLPFSTHSLAPHLIDGAQHREATPSGFGRWKRFSQEETERTEDGSQLLTRNSVFATSFAKATPAQGEKRSCHPVADGARMMASWAHYPDKRTSGGRKQSSRQDSAG